MSHLAIDWMATMAKAAKALPFLIDLTCPSAPRGTPVPVKRRAEFVRASLWDLQHQICHSGVVFFVARG